MPLQACEEALDKAVEDLFADPQIQAVGIARHDGAFGAKTRAAVVRFQVAVKNNRAVLRPIPIQV